MSQQIGLDLSPFALRACSLLEDGESRSLSTVYSPKGCAASDEYDSAERWDDPLAFRGRTFGRRFEINDIEKTVDYRKPDTSGVDWLKAYVQRLVDEQDVTFGSRFVATIPDHATPDEKDNVLRGLGSTGLGKPLLLWRPVAAALYWLGRQVDVAALDGHRLVVLDLDGPAPEVTEFELVKHEKKPEFVIPVRAHPKRHQILKSRSFHARCYQLVMNGFEESLQLIEGQFSSEIQSALEQRVARKDVWVRRNAAWTRKAVEFAADLPEGILNSLDVIFRNLSCDEHMHVICVGWLARRYPKKLSEQLKLRLKSNIEVLPAEAVSAGAARFGDLLAKGCPTYYDKLPCYRWWNSRKAEWVELFGRYQRVEPGYDYVYPAAGEPPCKLPIDKFNDNVSMYVQVMTEDGKYEGDEVYAHRLKLHFAEFLRVSQVVALTARVNPQEGSASFTIMSDAPIFKIGNKRSRFATLRYSEDPDANSYSSVQIVHEHEGYLEPQPVLGRIYDCTEYVTMVERLLRYGPTDPEFKNLRARYLGKHHGKLESFLSQRMGWFYSRTEKPEPTRGLFGTQRVPDSRIDGVSDAFGKHEWGTPYRDYDKFTACNYCFWWAAQGYKDKIRDIYRRNLQPDAFGVYYAPAYVLGEDPSDLALVIGYYKNNAFTLDRHEKIWWGIFRMLCWHPEIKFREQDRALVADFITRSVRACKFAARKNYPISELGKQSLLYSLLFMMRVREDGWQVPPEVIASAIELVATYLRDVRFPKTMVNNMNGSRQKPGDNLTKYVLRFLKCEDDLQDRELGAAMGGV